MDIGTGQTVYEQILSVNQDNIVVTGVTFDTSMYKNGVLYTGITVNTTLVDASKGIYTAEWSASTTGDYQLYAKNNTTFVIFIADNITVKTEDELNTSVYVGI